MLEMKEPQQYKCTLEFNIKSDTHCDSIARHPEFCCMLLYNQKQFRSLVVTFWWSFAMLGQHKEKR